MNSPFLAIGVCNTSKNDLPEYKTHGSAAVDLRANGDYVIIPGETVAIPTGLHVAIPDGWQLNILSRSGLAAEGIFVANAPGLIDSDYRGEIKVILHNASNDSFIVKSGDRIAQAYPTQVILIGWYMVGSVADLGETDRGEGGLGHSGMT